MNTNDASYKDLDEENHRINSGYNKRVGGVE